MFSRLTVKTLLQSTLLALTAMAVVPLSMRVWDAWSELHANGRILAAADASADAFQAMINIRSDRSSTPRIWKDKTPPAPDMVKYVKAMQDTEMGALRSLQSRLADMEFVSAERLRPALRRAYETLTSLQTEFWSGIQAPIASRRPGLGDEYTREGEALQTLMEDISASLYAGIHRQDAAVDQMMTVKQLAWIARDRAGDAMVLISRGLAAGSLPADIYRKYDTHLGGSFAAWRAIEDVMFGTEAPPALAQAMANAKQVYFAPDYNAMREKTLAALTGGGNPGITANEWSMIVVPKLGAMLGVAEAALTAAKDRAGAMRSGARQSLIAQSILLLLTLAGAIAGIVTLGRRLIHPLSQVRDAMTGLANGTEAGTVSLPARDDEIGALVRALRVFQEQAAAKASLERAERETLLRESTRRETMETAIRSFEDGARAALTTLSGAAAQMTASSAGMETISARTSLGVQSVATAASETSDSVTGIAAATEELSSSIVEIGRHVTHATGVTRRAVEETRRTDATVRGLAESAGRIGEVVRLINDIAGRTNLLALNATIEAARAGEAGKGFAVVATEVKSLANQTAKATEEIARHISEVQGVTDEAVKAIQRIGATIDEVDAIATSIASGVEQQDASTQEIARNVQQAAQRTREMTETIGIVSRDAKAADSTASDVKSASAAMTGEADTLRHRVDTFLDGIRAA